MNSNLDIVLHIGFPKCASTTLQDKVFKFEDGYLGTHKGLKKSDNLAKQFQKLTPAGPRLTGNISQAKKWRDRILEIKKKRWPNTSRLILSSEPLVNKNKIDDRPIIGFLKRFNNQVWNCGKVKIVLVVRNPAERLASSYAQLSILNPNASQNDFRKYVVQKIKDKNLIKYGSWVNELYENFGRENICVLLMEDINKVSFWEELKTFCELENFDSTAWTSNMSSLNTRKKNALTWNLRSYDANYRAKVLCNNLIGILWPSHLLKPQRDVFYNALLQALSRYFKAVHFKENNTSTNIELTPKLRLEVQQSYAEQTKKLSSLLDRDLFRIGY